MIYSEDFINKVIFGDNLEVMKDIPNECINLIYLDPPYGSNDTDKPFGLVCKASSNKGNVVLDPFCGSGTTLAAAWKLNRNYIGIDNNEEAIRISRNRPQLRQLKL